MFEKITPEQAGVSSKLITKFVNMLNDRKCHMHGILMMKGDNVFFETYYKPFTQDYLHRMYSQTKSYVGVAIGLLIEDGKISLDDPIYKYFPEKIHKDLDTRLKSQTIRDNLMMRTSVRPPYWFFTDTFDRVEEYFETEPFRYPGLSFEYDSTGTQVLCALVEKITGLKLIEFLRQRLFNKMGTFKDAYCLQTPEGTSWGDSALLCTLRDNASFGRLLMNYGNYKGEQLINREYVKEATSNLTDSSLAGYNSLQEQGYGYQIWQCERNGFAFVGMGNQLTFMFRDPDILVTVFSSDQGFDNARQYIANGVYEIIDNASKASLKEDKKAYDELKILSSNLELYHTNRKNKSPLSSYVEGHKYICEPNEMNIKWFQVDINDNKGVFKYENASGYKEIEFGIGYNIFSTFPEEGYSDMVGKLKTKGYFYKSATSGGYTSDNRITIDIQIIDKYFANSFFFINFDKLGNCYLSMKSYAENFLREYRGEAIAHRE